VLLAGAMGKLPPKGIEIVYDEAKGMLVSSAEEIPYLSLAVKLLNNH
jgi:hypothetical protein